MLRIFSHGLIESLQRTVWSSPGVLQSSCMITASAPLGIGEPVKILMQVPSPTLSTGWAPAGITPIQLNSTGDSVVAPFRSALLAAYPSMAELSKPGSDTPAFIGEATNRPPASAKGTISLPSKGAAASDRSTASSSDNIRWGVLPLIVGESNLPILSIQDMLVCRVSG